MAFTRVKKRVWSKEQKAIFREYKNGTDHVVIEAGAGTGKTTTNVTGISYAPEDRITFAAFNKRIQEDVKEKCAVAAPSTRVQTFNSIGSMFVRSNWSTVDLDPKKSMTVRVEPLSRAVCPSDTPGPIIALVNKLHTKGREMVPRATEPGELHDIAMQFECDPGDEWGWRGYDTDFVIENALKAMDLAAKGPTGGYIDFADQIFLPIRNNWLRQITDLTVVDEMQDMNDAQLDMMKQISGGRIFGVGDRNQAIYAFRGADSEAMSRTQQELNAKILGLRTTYRCGKAIVAEANRLVPNYFAGPDNPDGIVRSIMLDALRLQAQPGDFVLSRVNAPLVKIAMTLLRNGVRARVAGKQIGKDLITLVRKFSRGAMGLADILRKMREWEDTQALKWTEAGEFNRVITIRDNCEMIRHLADGVSSIDDLAVCADDLFSDGGSTEKDAQGIVRPVVMCSSVHKAKGLEADRVFVLKDTLYPWGDSQEERNIEYVAITRAKNELVWVFGK